MIQATPGTKQFTYDIARAVAAGPSGLPFEDAWVLTRLVLDFGGGPVAAKGRTAPLDRAAVRRLLRGGLVEPGGDEGTQRAKVSSVLAYGSGPGTWTATASVSSRERLSGAISVSDEGISVVVGHVPPEFRRSRSVASSDGLPGSARPIDPSAVLGHMVGGVVAFAFTRREVEAGVPIDSQQLLAALDTTYGREHFFQSVSFGVSGFDADPRELFEIPEVRRFAARIVEEFPWGYFLVTGQPLLRLLAMCVTGAEFDRSTGQVRRDPQATYDVAIMIAAGADRTAGESGFAPEERARLRADIEHSLSLPEGTLTPPASGDRPSTQLSPLQQQREAWLDDQVDAVIDLLGDEGSRLTRAVLPNLGEPRLVVATFAARIAYWIGLAHGPSEVADRALGLCVFRSAADTAVAVRSLIDIVSSFMSHRGMPIAERWLPESGYVLLLERWAARQREAHGDAVFRYQLRDAWCDADHGSLEYLLGLPLAPLAGVVTIDEALRAERRKPWAHVVGEQFEWEDIPIDGGRLLNALHLDELPHLRVLAEEISNSRDLRQNLKSSYRAVSASSDHDYAPEDLAGMKAAFERLRALHDVTLGELRGLSVFEVQRVLFDADRRLQDACLDGYVHRYKLTPLQDRLRGSHGTFGALPWWRVPVAKENAAAAAELLGARAGGFAYEDSPGDDLPFDLVSPSGAHVYGFDYDLNLFEDVCELMLIGRAGRVGVDLESDEGGRRVRRGAVSVGVSRDLADYLLNLATRRARAMLGADDGFQSYDAVRHAVDSFFVNPSTSWNRPAPTW